MLAKFLKNVFIGFFQLILKLIGWNPILPLIPELYLLSQENNHISPKKTFFVHNFDNIFIKLIVFLFYGANPDHPLFQQSSYLTNSINPSINWIHYEDYKSLEDAKNIFVGGLDFENKEFIIKKLDPKLSFDNQISSLPSFVNYINYSSLLFFILFFIGLYYSYFLFNLNILNIFGILSLFFKFI